MRNSLLLANQMEVSRVAKREVRVCALGICSNQLLSRDKFIAATILIKSQYPSYHQR